MPALPSRALDDDDPDPLDALERDLPAYTDFARAYIHRAGGIHDDATVRQLADDAIQDAWLDLRANTGFDPERPVRPWVKQHVRTAAREILRRRRRDTGRLHRVADPAPQADTASPEDEAYALLAGTAGHVAPDEPGIDRERLWDWVEHHTTRREREMIRLYGQGYTSQDLADKLNAHPTATEAVSAKTVNVQRHRLAKRLAAAYAADQRAPLLS